MSIKDNFSAPFELTSAENGKALEVKYFQWARPFISKYFIGDLLPNDSWSKI